MRKLELSTVGYVILFIILVLLFTRIPAKAQDTDVSICRDTTYPTLRFEFHFPADWLQVGSDVQWNYWAGGVASTDVENVWVADALPVETDGYAADTVALVRYDKPLTLIGDSTTAACAPVSTPTAPVETAPMPPVAINAPIVAAVVSTGKTCVVQYPKVILVCGS